MTLESRERWIRAAEGWEAQADAWSRDSMPVSSWMVEAIAPQPGQTILDLAAGVGETGFLAAELIQPGGTLITSDFVPEMLAAAQRRAQRRQITNVRFRQIDLSVPIDQPAASLDGILCRWGYMLLDDPESALRDTRRVLKRDARVALAAWSSPDENPWSVVPVRILQERGIVAPDDPGAGQFAWADPALIVDTMESAGFIEPDVQAVEFDVHYSSIDDWWVAQTRMSSRTRDADSRIDFATRSDVLADLERAAAPFLRADDSLVVPARTWVAAATA